MREISFLLGPQSSIIYAKVMSASMGNVKLSREKCLRMAEYCVVLIIILLHKIFLVLRVPRRWRFAIPEGSANSHFLEGRCLYFTLMILDYFFSFSWVVTQVPLGTSSRQALEPCQPFQATF